MTRKQLSNSIAGVAIAVALVPPLCVSGIGLTLGSEMVAVFGRGTVAGLTNQIAEGSFRSDPAEFDKFWEQTVDKGWPAVDLIGDRTYEEHRSWKDFVDAGGDDPSATFEGGIGLIHHPLTYETEVVGKWTSREKRKRGRPAKRKSAG